MYSGLNSLGGLGGYSPYTSSFDNPYSMGYNSLGMGMSPLGLGAGMGYNQLPFGSSLVQNLEQYMMTSSRVSSLLQMSLQSVAMTVQAATQLAQTGVMLQQEHSLQQQQNLPQVEKDTSTEPPPLLNHIPPTPDSESSPSILRSLLPPSVLSLLDSVTSVIPPPPAYIRDRALHLLARLTYLYHKRQWQTAHRRLCRARPHDKALLSLRMRAFMPPICEGEPSRWWWTLVAVLVILGWRVARVGLGVLFSALRWLFLGKSGGMRAGSSGRPSARRQAYRQAWDSALRDAVQRENYPHIGIPGMYNPGQLQEGGGWGGVAAFAVVCGVVGWVILRAVKAARAQQAQMQQLQAMQAQAQAQAQAHAQGPAQGQDRSTGTTAGGGGMSLGMGNMALGTSAGMGVGGGAGIGALGMGMGTGMGVGGVGGMNMGLGMAGMGTGLSPMGAGLQSMGGLAYNSGMGALGVQYGGINGLNG